MTTRKRPAKTPSGTYEREFEPTDAYRDMLSEETRKRLEEYEEKVKRS